MKNRKWKEKRGFTLVELICVIAIHGILMAVQYLLTAVSRRNLPNR